MYLRPILAGARAFAVRALWLALLWWILSEGVREDWTLPILTVLVASGSSLLFWKPRAWQFRFAGFLTFIPFFLRQSFLGGMDVAWRAMHPSMPLRPGLVEVQVRVEHAPGRVFLAWVISLLPGTVVANLHGDQIVIHSLDTRSLSPEEKLRELEEHISGLFSEDRIRLGKEAS